MVLHREVETIDGQIRSIEATTFCIHGDNAGASAILRFIHEQLGSHNIILK